MKRIGMVLAASLWLCACAQVTPVPVASTADPAIANDHAITPPPGFVDFCHRYADQCDVRDDEEQVALTPDTLRAIRLVNLTMNKAIQPEDDPEHYDVDEYWTIPLDGLGDCDDYVMVKRKALLTLGFPQNALHVAEVVTPHFALHVVLVVGTDKGNYVLDNLDDKVTTWDQTPYTWVKWQDPESRTGWSSLK